MKEKTALLLAALLLVLCASCSGGATAPAENGVRAADAAAYESNMDSVSLMEPGAEMPAGGGVGAQIYTREDAKLIRRAWLTMQTTEFDQALEALDRLTDACGGYYELVETQGGDYYARGTGRWASYTVRVPRERYTDFLGQVGDVGYIVRRSESSEDIGREYYDMELRLETQKTKQERLLSLLEKAEKMEDIIALETALTETRYQIEELTSTLKTYDSLVDYATIELELEEVAKITETPAGTAPFSVRLGNAFRQGVDRFGTAIGDLAVWLAYHLIGVLAFAAVMAVAVAAARRKLRLPKLKKAPPTEEKRP